MSIQRIVMAALVVTTVIIGTSDQNRTTVPSTPSAATLVKNRPSDLDRQLITQTALNQRAESELADLTTQK